MSEWKKICRVNDIPVLGSRRVARPKGMDVAVFRNSEDQGIVFGTRVACPQHNWSIGLCDGQAAAPDEGCTISFACKVDGGEVYLDAGELATLALDLVPPKAGPGAASAGAIGDQTFAVQTPHSA